MSASTSVSSRAPSRACSRDQGGSAVRTSQEFLHDPAGIATIDAGVGAPHLNVECQLGQSFGAKVVREKYAATWFHLGGCRRTPIGMLVEEDFDEFLE